MQKLNSFHGEFGDDRFFLAGIEADDVFSLDAMELSIDFELNVMRNPYVKGAAGFANMQQFFGDSDELFVKGLQDSIDLLHQVKNAEGTSDEIRKSYSGYPYYVNRFFSSDSRMMLFYIDTKDENEGASQIVMDQIQNYLGVQQQKYTGYFSGLSVTDSALNEQILSDQLLFMPLVFGSMILLLLLITRRIFETLVASFLQAFLVVVVMGAYALLGFKANVIISLVIPILVTVTLANSIHMIMALHDKAPQKEEFTKCIIEIAAHLKKPFLFTALTTMAGLLSFSPVDIKPLSHMGYLSAAGVLVALGLNLFILPVFLSFGEIFYQKPPRHLVVSGYLQKMAIYLMRHAGVLRVVILIVACIFMTGVFKIKIESDFVKYFKENHWVRQNFEYLNKKLSGVVPLEVMVQSKNGEPIAKDPILLTELDQKIQGYTLKNSVQVLSVIPILKKLHGALDENGQEIIPQKRSDIAELYLLAESSGEQFLSHYKSADDTVLRLQFFYGWQSAEEIKRMGLEIKTLLQNEKAEVELTGNGWLWVVLNDYLLKSQLISLLLSLGVVSFLMMILLKSIKLGLISLLPNIFPLILGGGLMGFLGYPVDLVTVMIFSLTMGVVVDDTIHYFTRYRELIKNGMSQQEAIVQTHGSIGVSIVYTALILTFGFGILCLASFEPTFRFGLITAITLLVSVVCELIMGPVMLKGNK